MRVIRCHDYELKPWKNGRGKTREIASHSAGDKLVWRISLAVVEDDGPFSNFEGLERILTVVRGDGMRLVGEKAEYDACPFVPVRFSGGEKIVGYCRSTPIENFNLIFNPGLVDAEVRIVDEFEIFHILGDPMNTTILQVLDGQISCDGDFSLAAQDTGICKGAIPNLRASRNLRCAVISLSQR